MRTFQSLALALIYCVLFCLCLILGSVHSLSSLERAMYVKCSPSFTCDNVFCNSLSVDSLANGTSPLFILFQAHRFYFLHGLQLGHYCSSWGSFKSLSLSCCDGNMGLWRTVGGFWSILGLCGCFLTDLTLLSLWCNIFSRQLLEVQINFYSQKLLSWQ